MPAEKKFKTAKAIEAAIEKYFKKCDNNTKSIMPRGAAKPVEIPAPIPYTIEGLARCLGIDRRTLLNYEKQKGYEEFYPIIKDAKAIVLQNKMERGLSGDSPATFAIFDLKCNYGFRENEPANNSHIDGLYHITKIRENLSAPQKHIHKFSERFRALVAGRRFGKTTLIASELAEFALLNPGSILLYLAPTYPMCTRVLAPMLNKAIPKDQLRKVNEGNYTYFFNNGSVLYMGGAQKSENFRGLGLDFACLDEAANIPCDAWFEVVRPALSDKLGSAFIVGTPDGKSNWFYDITLDRDFKVFQYTTADGGFVSEEEIESAKRMLDKRTFRQEYLASFESMSGAVYYAYGDHNNTDITYSPKCNTIMAWDFNVNPMSTILLQEYEKDMWAAVNEFVIPNTNTEYQCQLIKTYFEENGKPVQLQCAGDYSGRSHKSSASFTDYEIIRKHFKNYPGWSEKTRPTIKQKDRIAATNSMFSSESGYTRLYVNKAKCPKLDKDLKKVEWKEGGMQIDKGPGISDPSDALSYMPYNYYPLRAKSTTRILSY